MKGYTFKGAIMQKIQVAELKANFSDILNHLEKDQEEYIIQYGRKHKKVAVLIPYEKYEKNYPKIKLGILSKSGSCKIKDDFEISSEELLGL